MAFNTLRLRLLLWLLCHCL